MRDGPGLVELTADIVEQVGSAPECVRSALCAHIGAIRALTQGVTTERLLESLGRVTGEMESGPPRLSEPFHKGVGDIDT